MFGKSEKVVFYVPFIGSKEQINSDSLRETNFFPTRSKTEALKQLEGAGNTPGDKFLVSIKFSIFSIIIDRFPREFAIKKIETITPKPVSASNALPVNEPKREDLQNLLFDNRFGERIQPKLITPNSVKSFLNLAPQFADENFLSKLDRALPNNFYEIRPSEQVNFLKSNRDILFPIFNLNWRLACVFLDKVVNNDHQLRAEILSSQRYEYLYIMNRLRQQIIPSHLRQIVPMNLQQRRIEVFLQEQQEQQRNQLPPPKPYQAPHRADRTMFINRLEDQKKIEIPEEFVDPITREIMKDPVMFTDCGKTWVFERASIECCIDKNGENPFTRQKITKQQLIPATELKAKIEAYKNEQFDRYNSDDKEEHELPRMGN